MTLALIQKVIVEIYAESLALTLIRKLSFLRKICVRTVIINRYGFRNDSGCHLIDA